MREIHRDERPRERLLDHGVEVLSEAELLAVVLGTGSRGENVLDLARRILETLGGVAGLVRAGAPALQLTRGLGPAKAAQVAAAIELGRRVQQVDPEARPMLDTPEAVYALLGSRLIGQAKEHLYVLSLDTRGRLLGAPTRVLVGTVNGVGVRPAEIFREPIVREATFALLVHNHPSGDPRPSPQDVAVTNTLVAAGKLLDLDVVDHVIVGANRFLSLKREGYAFRNQKP